MDIIERRTLALMDNAGIDAYYRARDAYRLAHGADATPTLAQLAGE